jgi:hypothetical protein
MTDTDIHARLLALGKHLSKAEKMLARRKAEVDPAHLVTNQELRDRYNALSAQVAREEASEEAHGQHVSALEHSVRMWVERLDSDLM